MSRVLKSWRDNQALQGRPVFTPLPPLTEPKYLLLARTTVIVSKPTLTGLPADLIRHILARISDLDAFALMRTSRQFQQICHKWLRQRAMLVLMHQDATPMALSALLKPDSPWLRNQGPIRSLIAKYGYFDSLRVVHMNELGDVAERAFIESNLPERYRQLERELLHPYHMSALALIPKVSWIRETNFLYSGLLVTLNYNECLVDTGALLKSARAFLLMKTDTCPAKIKRIHPEALLLIQLMRDQPMLRKFAAHSHRMTIYFLWLFAHTPLLCNYIPVWVRGYEAFLELFVVWKRATWNIYWTPERFEYSVNQLPGNWKQFHDWERIIIYNEEGCPKRRRK